MIPAHRIRITFAVLVLLAVAGVGLLPLTGRPQDKPPPSAAPTAEQLLAVEQLGQLRRELVQVQSDLRKARIELTALLAKSEKVAELEVSDAVLEEHLKKDAAFAKTLERVSQLEEQFEIVRSKTSRGENDPAVKHIRRQIQEQREYLDARREKLRPAVRQEFRARAQAELQARIEPLQERIAQQKQMESLLEKDVKRLGEQTRNVPVSAFSSADSQRLARVEDEVRQLRIAVEELRDLLLKKGR
jgi:hypothetical protein